MISSSAIVALSSGSLPSAIAIVRISGLLVRSIVDKFVDRELHNRHLVYCNICDPDNGDLIDRGMVTFFPKNCSYTGEEVAEFHVHGSVNVVTRLISALTDFENVRLAGPGEFTRRAFENGKLDLIQVEAIGELIASTCENQRQLALSRLGHGLGGHLKKLQSELSSLLVQVESTIDFSAEDDVGTINSNIFRQTLTALSKSISDLLVGFESGRLVKEGARIGFGGMPNVGKSSIVNSLARSEVAIVSNEAGTTRDLNETEILINGQNFILIDCAGIHDTNNPIELEGIRRAREMLDLCDLIFWVSSPDVPDSSRVVNFSPRTIHIANKSDLGRVAGADFAVSVSAGHMEPIRKVLSDFASSLSPGSGGLLLCRERDRREIAEIGSFVKRMLEMDLDHMLLESPELVAELLRGALFTFQRLFGQIDAEDILDGIFADFCIGK